MSSGVTKDGTARVPSAYVCDGILFTNHKGEQVDIQHIVNKFTIQESIYSPTLMCEFAVRDAVNFLEFHEIIGQEVVTIKITKKDPENEKKINLKFFITEYPLFARSDKQDSVAAFTFRGVSRHAYLNQLKKISKSYQGNAADVIFNLITEKETGLDFPKENMIGFKDDVYKPSEECISFIKGVIPFQSPLNAAAEILRSTVDIKGSPFFLYQTLHGNMHLKSLSQLFNEEKNPQYGGPDFSYIKTTNFKADPQTNEDYSERMRRIIGITSDLKLNVIGQMSAGTYASRNNFLDISSKKYVTESYNYINDFVGDKSNVDSDSNIDPEWKINDKNLGEYDSAHCTYLSTNDALFSEFTEIGLNDTDKLYSRYRKSHLELLETQTHDVQLYGDIDLNAGTVIHITIPKAIDNKDQKPMQKESEIEQIDELISGRYLITSAIHTFKGGNMMTKVQLKRDSFKKLSA